MYVLDTKTQVHPKEVPELERASRARLDALMKEKGATLWIQHDLLTFNKLKKSPEYYE